SCGGPPRVAIGPLGTFYWSCGRRRVRNPTRPGSLVQRSLRLLGGVSFEADPRFQQLGPWPYPAEYFLVALSAFFGSVGTSALYPVLVRIPSVAADAGTGILIFRIAKHLGSPDHQARTAAYAYLLNPFAIIVSAIWG